MWVNFCSYMAGHFNQLNKPYDMSHTELVLPMSFADEFCYNMEFTFRIPFEEDFEPWVKRVTVVYLIDYWKRCSNILKNQAFILQSFSINGDLTLENIFFALIKLFDSDNVSR